MILEVLSGTLGPKDYAAKSSLYIFQSFYGKNVKYITLNSPLFPLLLVPVEKSLRYSK